ncbi:DUF6941 family protein [Actinomadura hibisca]|uniref:DUF6941 family protein n=1 Tax=Actinomadura hibisca TaxID=68565 RepID=UPI0008321AAA|nr:hypothetical protein [Actinomadura hibisca]
MPELDYMVLADYVRIDNGIAHIIGANFDTIYASQLPSARTVHAALRFVASRDDVPGASHALQLIISSEDRQIGSLTGTVVIPDRSPGTPVHWRTGLFIDMQIPLLMTTYGDYAIDLVLNGEQLKSVDLRVVPGRPEV